MLVGHHFLLNFIISQPLFAMRGRCFQRRQNLWLFCGVFERNLSHFHIENHPLFKIKFLSLMIFYIKKKQQKKIKFSFSLSTFYFLFLFSFLISSSLFFSSLMFLILFSFPFKRMSNEWRKFILVSSYKHKMDIQIAQTIGDKTNQINS